MMITALIFLVLLGAALVLDRRADLREAEAEARYGPVGQMIRVMDTDVHALVTGTGPDLVLIHGASGNLRDYTFSLVEELAKSYRVIAFDRPGHGWTQRLPAYRGTFQTQAETLSEQVQVLRAASATLNVTQPIVVGHSYGGAVALAWGLAAPEDTAAIVTIGGVANPWESGLSALYRTNASKIGGAVFVPLLAAFAGDKRVDDAVTSIFAPDPVPDGYMAHIGTALSLRRTSLKANAQQIRDLKQEIIDMSPRYSSELSMPVEIVHGTADTIVPNDIHAEVLARQLQNARFTRLPGVGHMPQHVDQAAILNAIDSAASRADLR